MLKLIIIDIIALLNIILMNQDSLYSPHFLCLQLLLLVLYDQNLLVLLPHLELEDKVKVKNLKNK